MKNNKTISIKVLPVNSPNTDLLSYLSGNCILDFKLSCFILILNFLFLFQPLPAFFSLAKTYIQSKQKQTFEFDITFQQVQRKKIIFGKFYTHLIINHHHHLSVRLYDCIYILKLLLTIIYIRKS
jgi:hypothetical protein